MPSDAADYAIDDDTIFTCWCGEKGTYSELFGEEVDETCGGSGVINCYCGGDQCVCHHHGEVQCDGCQDCDDRDAQDDYDYPEDDHAE